MATSNINELKTITKTIGIKTFENAAIIVIPLETTQSPSSHASVTVINGNADVLATISTGTRIIVNNHGNTNIVANMNGTNLEIARDSGTLWGDTLIIVNTNYALSWGG